MNMQNQDNKNPKKPIHKRKGCLIPLSIFGLLVIGFILIGIFATPPENRQNATDDSRTQAPTAEAPEVQTEQIPEQQHEVTNEPSMLDEQEISVQLANMGLESYLIQAVIETMRVFSDNVSYDIQTFEITEGYRADIIRIEPSQIQDNTVNLKDYLGLRSERAYISREGPDDTESFFARIHLGEGVVEDRSVYAVANHSLNYRMFREQDQTRLTHINLYQIDGEIIYTVGEIRNGEVTWHTSETRRAPRPLIMEVGKVYSTGNTAGIDSMYNRSTHEIIGFRNVTIDGVSFENCVELRRISKSAFDTGLGVVVSTTFYYSVEYGRVHTRFTMVNIALNEITVHTSASAIRIDALDPSQLVDMMTLAPHDVYPFVPSQRNSGDFLVVTSGLISIPPTWEYELWGTDTLITGEGIGGTIGIGSGWLNDGSDWLIENSLSQHEFLFDDGNVGYVILTASEIWWINGDSFLSFWHNDDWDFFYANEQIITAIAQTCIFASHPAMESHDIRPKFRIVFGQGIATHPATR